MNNFKPIPGVPLLLTVEAVANQNGDFLVLNSIDDINTFIPGDSPAIRDKQPMLTPLPSEEGAYVVALFASNPDPQFLRRFGGVWRYASSGDPVMGDKVVWWTWVKIPA